MVGQASRLSINYDGQDARPTSDPLSCGDCFAPLALSQTSGAYRNRKGDSPVAPTDPRDLEDFDDNFIQAPSTRGLSPVQSEGRLDETVSELRSAGFLM